MAFSFKDHLVQLYKVVGDAGEIQKLRLRSGNKIGLDPGPKAAVMKGYDVRPLDIIYQAADPKVTLDGMEASETQDAIGWLGGLYCRPFGLIIVVQRIGRPTRHIKVVGMATGEGGNWDADDNGAVSKLGGPFTDLLWAKGSGKLASIYAPRVQ
jgi:hypothetical protein